LVAEDNNANWEFMDSLLSAMGCKAVRASDGAEAVKKALELAPPLILMDVQMPGMDGLEAIRRIRATPMVGGHTPKILALTALALPGDRERCLLAGAEQYLSKPVDLSVLRATIRTLISANPASL
jgi:CheY-like chemotaxis protein